MHPQKGMILQVFFFFRIHGTTFGGWGALQRLVFLVQFLVVFLLMLLVAFLVLFLVLVSFWSCSSYSTRILPPPPPPGGAMYRQKKKKLQRGGCRFRRC